MKYIIDISDKAIDFMGGHISVFVEPVFKTGDCKRYVLRLSKEDIEPYTEPDEDKIKQKVENEVWDFARSINYLGYDDFVSCFSGKTEEQVYELSYSEVKAAYEAWKAEHEIRVGDEVDIDGEITVVTMVNKYDEILSVDCDGMTYYYNVESQLKRAKKTGRHFDEVEDLLKKIKEK